MDGHVKVQATFHVKLKGNIPTSSVSNEITAHCQKGVMLVTKLHKMYQSPHDHLPVTLFCTILVNVVY